MPHAIDRLFATPKIRPRLPRNSPTESGMTVLDFAGLGPAAPYGIGSQGLQVRRAAARNAGRARWEDRSGSPSTARLGNAAYSIPLRGSYGFPSRHLRIISSSSGSLFSGKTM